MIIIGIAGLELQNHEKKQLQNENCAGVILFTRNYADRKQLQQLCAAIRAERADLLIGVDHEGGRVQRFRHDFTVLPPMSALGQLFLTHPMLAVELTQAIGLILAYELRTAGLDFSFAPVLDLQDARSTVIGTRAFSPHPAIVALLASALRRGMRQAGMAAIGKHFPGHGRVRGDSHHVLPHDSRPPAERENDLFPFWQQIEDGIEGIMPAHIVLPESDLPAGFAPYFMQQLRSWGFTGAIISDDLDMNGAMIAGNPVQRVQAALSAGADAALMCNDFAGIAAALQGTLNHPDRAGAAKRLGRLRGQIPPTEQDYWAARATYEKHAAMLVA